MDEKFTYYRPFLVTCLWIYRFIHRTDSFIRNGDELEYTKKYYFKYEENHHIKFECDQTQMAW